MACRYDSDGNELESQASDVISNVQEFDLEEDHHYVRTNESYNSTIKINPLKRKKPRLYF